ncbi:MAG: enoyl-CoA hydratase-related protein [Balneolaceae bacterium]|nr:enoyl-CoA hydratase-related protein [Balneolaceae bacterium]
MEMILTGKQIQADEAHSIGLLNHVFDSDSALKKVKEIALKIMKNGPVAITAAIAAINAGSGANQGYAKEATLFGQLCETDDFKEGTSAFLEKRKANFTGN